MISLRLLSYLSLVVPSEAPMSPGFGVTGFALAGPLEAGASFDGELAPFEYARWGYSSHLGLRVPIERIELDAAATLGYGAMINGGPGLLSSNPGAHGSGAFVGGRGGVAFAFFRNVELEEHASIVLIFNYEHDLEQYEQHYSYEETGWLNGETTVYEDSARIGMDRLAIQLGLGVGF